MRKSQVLGQNTRQEITFSVISTQFVMNVRHCMCESNGRKKVVFQENDNKNAVFGKTVEKINSAVLIKKKKNIIFSFLLFWEKRWRK